MGGLKMNETPTSVLIKRLFDEGVQPAIQPMVKKHPAVADTKLDAIITRLKELDKLPSVGVTSNMAMEGTPAYQNWDLPEPKKLIEEPKTETETPKVDIPAILSGASKEPKNESYTPLEDPKSLQVYRNFILPALGVIEAAVSKGRSPGTAAIQQMGILETGAQNREALNRLKYTDMMAAKKAGIDESDKAIERKINTIKLGGLERTQKSEQELQDAMTAIESRRQKGELTDEEISKSTLNTVRGWAAKYDPDKYLKYVKSTGKGKIGVEDLPVKDQFEMTNKIVDNIKQDKTVQNYTLLTRYNDSLNNIKKGLMDGTLTGDSADNAIIKLVNLTLEPGLAVRTDDIQAIVGGQNRIDALKADLKRWSPKAGGGQGFDQTYRLKLIEIASRIYGVAGDSYRKALVPYGKITERYGLDPEDIFTTDQLNILGLDKITGVLDIKEPTSGRTPEEEARYQELLKKQR
jgi:hypothetical protein